MRATLRNGKIIAPTSRDQAMSRLQQLDYECAKIGLQFKDPTRADRYASPEEYIRWKGSASRALRLFEEEKRQLKEWLAEHPAWTQHPAQLLSTNAATTDPYELLREAHQILKALESEIDFEPEESLFMQKLEVFLHQTNQD